LGRSVPSLLKILITRFHCPRIDGCRSDGRVRNSAGSSGLIDLSPRLVLNGEITLQMAPNFLTRILTSHFTYRPNRTAQQSIGRRYTRRRYHPTMVGHPLLSIRTTACAACQHMARGRGRGASHSRTPLGSMGLPYPAPCCSARRPPSAIARLHDRQLSPPASPLHACCQAAVHVGQMSVCHTSRVETGGPDR